MGNINHMIGKKYSGDTHICFTPFEMFDMIRQYTEETKDTVQYCGSIVEWVNSSLDQRWILDPKYMATKADVEDLMKRMSPTEKEKYTKICRIIKNRDDDLLTQYLNHGDRILNLLSFA
jgi:hypothetical protein